MITKFNYKHNNGIVSRTAEYSFTGLEELSDRLVGIDNLNVIKSISAATLKGETERDLIELEDEWFKVQVKIQEMDAERVQLENKLTKGDKNGNPLDAATQEIISAKIADLKPGTVQLTKEFYNHYTRETNVVKEEVQTSYTILLEQREDLEASNPYLAGFRGITSAPRRPEKKLNSAKEIQIKKELVRQQIDIRVGDEKDLIADMANALSALIKKDKSETLTSDEQADINKFVERQTVISKILEEDYPKH